VLGALLLHGCAESGQTEQTAPGPPPAIVEVTKVQPTTIRNIVDLVGQLDSEESVMVRPEISGMVASHHFEEGKRVTKGQILFRLKQDEQRARLNEAQARARLAEDVHRRMGQLSAEKIASESELVRVTGELDVARASVERYRVTLDRTEIRSPFDGYAGSRLVSPGERVSPESDLVRIDAIDRLKLAFTVPERAVPLVRENQRVVVTVADHPGETFAGQLYFVAPAMDPATRRLLLKAWVENPGQRLRPGLFANIKVEVETRDNALALPESAIVSEGRGASVWRVGRNGQAEKVQVELGIREGDRVEVRSGLTPGDVIVTAGTNKVFPGSPIQAAPSGADRPAGKTPPAETPAAPQGGTS
jgi:membrane fusion protein (multidrug efflux system)